MTTDTHAFRSTLESRAVHYGVEIDEHISARLSDYFALVQTWNARLHLVAPCSPAEFATRHALESLCALPYLPPDACVVDVGSGAGLPVVPCLVARSDLQATLVEASTKKAVFLREALNRLRLDSRSRVLTARFEHVGAPAADVLTCRALERFTEMLPRLLAWSAPKTHTLLLFGGHAVREQIERMSLSRTMVLLPGSEQRFLFVIKRDAGSRHQGEPGADKS